MSLLLDARKKSKQAQPAQAGNAVTASDLSLEEHPHKTAVTEPVPQAEDAARSAGQNLFSAKSAYASAGHALPNRNLLLALGGTILLIGIGAGYLWYINSASGTRPLRPAGAPPAVPAPQPQAIAVNKPVTAQQPAPAPEINKTNRSDDRQIAPPVATPVINAPAATPQPHGSSPVRIERQQKPERLDPLLANAYAAYRNGKLDEAQRLYLSMLKKDARNADALLGLAAIAQQRGDNLSAAQYYGRALELDPRNPVANAGMAALTMDDGNNESRLKNLLREQGDSAVLHFALGNLYAEQSRWGEAQQAYFNAWTLESGNAEFAFNLAVSLEHLGQNKLAAQHYQRAMQLDPSHSAGFNHAQISQRIEALSR